MLPVLYLSGVITVWKVHAAPGLEARALLDAVILHLQHAGLGPTATPRRT